MPFLILKNKGKNIFKVFAKKFFCFKYKLYIYTIIKTTKIMTATKLNNTVKQIMVTYEFGSPVYISKGGLATDNKEEAEVWGLLDSNKLNYWKALTGYKLIFEAI